MTDYLPAILIGVGLFLLYRVFFAGRGRVTAEQARAKLKDGALLLDVRTPSEFASGALPGAKNVPVQVLGARLGELEKGRPIVVYCASGMRSGRAASLLRSEGFEVHDLGPASAFG